MKHVRELRSLVGHRPLIILGAAVLIFNNKNQLLLHHRQDNKHWGLIGGSLYALLQALLLLNIARVKYSKTIAPY